MHFLKISDFNKSQIIEIFSLSRKIKKNPDRYQRKLLGKTLAMIFEKPSLRTRVSFEVGMTQLGGHAVFLGPSDIQIGIRETPHDISRNLERMVDIIMARVFEHQKLIDLSDDSKVPVINGLSDLEHPCQAMADLFTVLEYKKNFNNLKIVFFGDCKNNVARSLESLCKILEINFIKCGPKKYGGESQNIKDCATNADVVITDTWISMGDEKEKSLRLKVFKSYQVNSDLMKLAQKNAIFMHCLPAYRGNEVVGDVIDGPQSVVFDEAENRLHVQKAIILYLLKSYS